MGPFTRIGTLASDADPDEMWHNADGSSLFTNAFIQGPTVY